LSLASFLLGLGVLLVPLGILVGTYLDSELRPIIVPTFVFGGLALVLVGTIMNNVIVWRHRRSGGSGSKLALSALLAGAVGVMIIITSVLLSFPWFGPDRGDSEARALGDCQSISTALLLFHRDTGTWPVYASATQGPDSRVDYFYGDMADMPRFTDGEVKESWGARAEDIHFLLVTNGRTDPWYGYGRHIGWEERVAAGKAGEEQPSAGGWDGPYLPDVTDDPWGYAYIVSVSGFEGGTKPDNHVWCLSAGVNGIVDTPAWATATRGDDVGYRTK